MSSLLASSLRMLLVLTVVTGVAYPLLVTGIAQVAFPAQANGSLVRNGDQVAGSALIGQPFADPRYFWGRPSATSPQPYNGAASSGSNLGARNPALADAVAGRVKALREADPEATLPVPADLVTASASGLDPHISVAAAQYQVRRVAKARGLSPDDVRALVARHVEPPDLGILGEPRVNVLRLNLDLDRAAANG
ncbi:MAG: potassium-transporting ATPase subunit KdpC [Burkholderiales bacterium]